jgi:hypothetical protein
MKPFRAALGLLLLAAVGCGDGRPKLVAVRGCLTLDEKPMPAKTVQFIPEPGTLGQGAGGNTDQNGHYTLLAVRPGATEDAAGIPPGKYRVIVTEPRFPIDLPVQDAEQEEATPAVGLPAPLTPSRKRGIPPVYSNPDTTPFHVEVSEEGGVIDLPLKTSAKPK